jgi:hypothetical protein
MGTRGICAALAGHAVTMGFLSLTCLLSGCFTRGLGDTCAREVDCAFGLRCFAPSAADVKVCTVGCDASVCSEGQCVTTDDGRVCARTCDSGADCDEGTLCQATSEQTTVCWVEDSHLSPLAEAVRVADVSVSNDTDGNGEVSPGESARLSIRAVNQGSELAEGVYATTTVVSPHVEISQCQAISSGGSSDHCEDDGTTCSCEDAIYRQDLAPGQTGEHELTRLDIEVGPGAGGATLDFDIVFADEHGNAWDDSFQVPLVSTGAVIEEAGVEVILDENGDLQLSPGETGRIGVWGRNSGTADAIDVYAVTSTTSAFVTVSRCWSISPAGSTGECDHDSQSCQCDELGYSHDLAPGGTSEREITRLELAIDAGAPGSPIPFEITFYDGLGNQWSDTFEMEVGP